ncbi:hypothetical protein Trydic_g4905 [Trypoxylus dichotomus]
MIDWVSIVRHSRRRFSNYMYGVPSKVRKRRRQKLNLQIPNLGATDNGSSQTSNCSCCWAEDMQKSRYVDDDMPPPPSPPRIRDSATNLDSISKHGSLERAARRKSSADRDHIARDIYKTSTVSSSSASPLRNYVYRRQDMSTKRKVTRKTPPADIHT